MTEYIEREAAIKLIASDKTEISPLLCALVPTYTAEQAFEGLNQSCDRHIKFINSIPSADVQPVKRGEWTDKRTIEHDGEWYCTVCGSGITIYMGEDRQDRYKFCPNCGADMRGNQT